MGDILKTVTEIRDNALAQGQQYLLDLTLKFDKISLESFVYEVPKQVAVAPELAQAIEIAAENIYKFHQAECDKISANEVVETFAGIRCFKKFTPIANVGIYVPNGLFSTLLMTIIPAKISGCKNIVICTPPNPSAALLYVCKVLDIEKIYTIGGAQAVFAMAYGIGEIPKVDKIFGPGNEYVDAAKRLVATEIAIDMPAGPSEVLVIADDKTDKKAVIYDLLAQLEHGKESRAWLFTTSQELIDEVTKDIAIEAQKFPRSKILEMSLKNLSYGCFADVKTAIVAANEIAPEHLIINVEMAETYQDLVENAGSVFVGKYTTESLGDYASGTNHVLPTAGFAKSYSGLSTLSFGKFITFQQASKEAVQRIGKHVAVMAEAENLQLHAQSILVRVE